MPAGNTLVGDDFFSGVRYESDSPSIAQPFSPSGGTAASPSDVNRIGNYVAFLVLFALAVLILIRVAGLQGMIAVGRGT